MAAITVGGAIGERWASTGGANGVMGNPLTGEIPTFDGVGRYQDFERGTISWHPELGAFWTWGAIRDRWVAMGREQWGYLLCDEVDAGDGRGKINHYRTMQLADRPDASIYWTPETGAIEVYGGIRARWIELGWQNSWLGYPRVPERDVTDGGRVTDFEHGSIYWWSDLGAIDIGSIALRYRGINCFGTSDPIGRDDPKILLATAADDGRRTDYTTSYNDVAAGGSFPAMHVIYQGPPIGVALPVTLIERDSGDMTDLKTKFDQAIADGAEAARAGLGSATHPLVGELAAGIVKAVGPSIRDFFVDWFGDDIIESKTELVSPKDFCRYARTASQMEQDVQFHFFSYLTDGDGTYKAYFDVIGV